MTEPHQEIRCTTPTGTIIVTEEGIVFTGPVDGIPLLADPVDELRDALDEISRLRGALQRIVTAGEMHNGRNDVIGWSPEAMIAREALA